MSADFPVVATSAGPLAGPQGLRPAPAPWAPEPPDENSEGTPQVARIVGALNRYKWMIVGLGLLGALGGVLDGSGAQLVLNALARCREKS